MSANYWWRLAINQSLIDLIFFRWRSVVWGLTLQFIFGLIILRWKVGRQVFQCLGDKMTTFLGFTENGSSFVYGFLIEEGVFMFKILSVIFFFSFMTRFVQKASIFVNQFLKLIVKKEMSIWLPTCLLPVCFSTWAICSGWYPKLVGHSNGPLELLHVNPWMQLLTYFWVRSNLQLTKT